MKGRAGPPFARALMVDSITEFDRMVRHLGGQPWVALDTESDSLFRYTPRVCLIQVSAPASRGNSSQDRDTENVRDFLVDPLKLKDLSALGGILADDGTEVILHAAENDILTLQRDFGFRIRRLYDTQLAARIMGRTGVGLAQVLLEEFDVVSDKRMQRTNWGQRPLTAQQMAYAQVDTHFLPALRARQTRQLKESGRWEEAQDAFRILETVEYSPPEPRTFWQMKQIRSVDEENLNVLETIWDWRERHSRRTERPPFKVLGESTLVALAQDRPQSIDALRKIKGLSGRQVDRFGRELLEALRQGERRPVPRRPAAAKRSDSTLSAEGRRRFDALRRWRTETAAARGVDPDIVFSNETLVQISAGRPDSVAALAAFPAIGRWKAKTYGPAVLKMLKGRGKE